MRFTCGGVAEGIVQLVASNIPSQQPVTEEKFISSGELDTGGENESHTRRAPQTKSRAKDGATILIAFALSGLTHTGMVPPAHAQAMEFRVRVVLFFLLQGVGIIVEELAWRICGSDPKVSQDEGEMRSDYNGSQEQRMSSKAVKRTVHLSFVLFWLWIVSVPLLVPVFDGLGWWRVGVPMAWWT